MPNEHEFMKSAKEKEMSDGEYKTLREEYDKKAEDLSRKMQKLTFVFLGIFAVSLAAIYINVTLKDAADSVSYTWLAAEFLLAIFLYDPKAEDDKKPQYETDRKILINNVKAKIRMRRLKFGLIIGFGVFFLILNIVWWIFFGSIETGETLEDLRRLCTAAFNI